MVTLATMVFPMKPLSLFYAVDAIWISAKVSQYFLLASHVHTEPRCDGAGSQELCNRDALRIVEVPGPVLSGSIQSRCSNCGTNPALQRCSMFC